MNIRARNFLAANETSPVITEADRLSAFASVPHELAELVVMRANQHGFSLRYLRSSCRFQYLVEERRSIAREARGMGYSYPVIGRALNRDHSTIIHALAKVEAEAR